MNSRLELFDEGDVGRKGRGVKNEFSLVKTIILDSTIRLS
jgi:hypothetical protein